MGEILFLAHRVPYPPDRGDKIRSFHLLERLREFGTVHLVAFADGADDLAAAEALRPRLGSLHVERRAVATPVAAARSALRGIPMSLSLFESSGIRDFVARTLAERPIDTVFAFSGQMAQFVPELPPGVRFVMDFVDVDSAKFHAYAEEARLPMRLVYEREARLLAGFESATARRADCSLFVSDAEAALFRSRAGLGEDSIRTLENGVDCAYYDPDVVAPVPEGDRGPLIVFTGQMDYRPNIEAVRLFVREGFPAVRSVEPHVRFAIVGRNPAAEVRRLARHEGVIVTGAVPDVRGWLAAAALVVAPLLVARGIQNKVLEAMAMARPVVASPAAFEGIDAMPGRDLCVARDRAEAVEAILDLLGQPSRADILGEAARSRVLDRYQWAKTLVPLAGIVGREGSA